MNFQIDPAMAIMIATILRLDPADALAVAVAYFAASLVLALIGLYVMWRIVIRPMRSKRLRLNRGRR